MVTPVRKKTATFATAEAAATPMVQDCVVVLDRSVFHRLKSTAEKKEEAEAPLDLPLRLVQSCAVDLRPKLKPPLPRSYVSSVAGIANVAVDVCSGRNLWEESARYSSRLRKAVEAMGGVSLGDACSRRTAGGCRQLVWGVVHLEQRR